MLLRMRLKDTVYIVAACILKHYSDLSNERSYQKCFFKNFFRGTIAHTMASLLNKAYK